MPTTALVTGPRLNDLRKYGTGPFGQLMMNLALAPPIGTPLIDLTGGPETWLRAPVGLSAQNPNEILISF